PPPGLSTLSLHDALPIWSFWAKFYEPAIRRAAGLGKAPRDPDPDRYLHRYAHCDVLVVGAGPAGLAAALAASEAGARVIICDEQDRKSTRLNSSHSQISY